MGSLPSPTSCDSVIETIDLLNISSITEQTKLASWGEYVLPRRSAAGGGHRGGSDDRVLVVSAKDISPEAFFRDLLAAPHPSGVGERKEPASSSSSSWKWEHLRDTFPYAGRDFADVLSSECGRRSVYLSQAPFKTSPSIESHLKIDEWFPSPRLDDIMHAFGRGLESEFHKFMIVTQKGGYLHKDALDSGFWNLVVSGRKRWWITSNWGRAMEARMDEIHPLHEQIQMPAFDWFRTVYPKVRAEHARSPLPNPLEVIVEAGDLIYVPAGGWYHQVLSLEKTVGVTYNMLTRFDYQRIMSGACMRTRHSHHVTARMCSILADLRPAWYSDSCCEAFLKNPERFPRATTWQELQYFAPLAVPRYFI